MHIFQFVILFIILWYLLMLLLFSITPFLSRRLYTAPSSKGITLAILPAAIPAVLFYTAAIHMYSEFSGWPPPRGVSGFSPSLTRHAEAAIALQYYLILGSFFGLPIAGLAVIFFRKARTAIPYLGAFAAATLLFHLSLFVMPSGFISWWMD